MALGVLRISTGTRFIALMTATVVLVACSSSASPTTSGSGPTLGPTIAVTPTEGPTSGVLPSFDLSSFKADVALEALLPDSLGGAALTKLSFSGTEFMTNASEETQKLQTLLTALGKTPADVSVALAANASMTVIAYRIKGVDANTFLTAFLQIGTDAGTVTTDVSISGKSVKKLTPDTGDVTYAYPSGDVIFIVTGTGQTDALVAEAFSKLR